MYIKNCDSNTLTKHLIFLTYNFQYLNTEKCYMESLTKQSPVLLD